MRNLDNIILNRLNKIFKSETNITSIVHRLQERERAELRAHQQTRDGAKEEAVNRDEKNQIQFDSNARDSIVPVVIKTSHTIIIENSSGLNVVDDLVNARKVNRLNVASDNNGSTLDSSENNHSVPVFTNPLIKILSAKRRTLAGDKQINAFDVTLRNLTDDDGVERGSEKPAGKNHVGISHTENRREAVQRDESNVDNRTDGKVGEESDDLVHSEDYTDERKTPGREVPERDVMEGLTINSFIGNYIKTFARYYPMFQEMETDLHILQTVMTRTTMATNLDRKLLASAGVPFKEFVVTCRFGGEPCNKTEDFKQFFDSYYYNCFTYQAPTTDDQSDDSSLAEGLENGWSTTVLTGELTVNCVTTSSPTILFYLFAT